MQFESLLAHINNTPLEPLGEFVQPTYLEQIRYGDHIRWKNLVADLPSATPSAVNFGARIEIGRQTDCDQSTLALIEQSLQQLIPWRKGPFSVFGIDIDSEWQSNLKWERLVDHIAPLAGKTVLDVGCGNGYYSLQMAAAGARLVIGLEPHIPYYAQFSAIKHFLPDLPAYVLPITLEKMPLPLAHFDTVFSMGVIYHRRSPIDHLMQLSQSLKPGGQLILESIVVPGDAGYSLMPKDKYARMGNVWFIPSSATLCDWLEKCEFKNIRIVDESPTTIFEQRRTTWMPFDSLEDALLEEDQHVTVEGYPAPDRAVILCEKPS